MKTTSDEALAAIEEAGKRIAFDEVQDWIQSAPKDALPILLALLAYDNFDTLAAELRELRAKMERVREYADGLSKSADTLKTPWPQENFPDMAVRVDRQGQFEKVARELAELLNQ